MRTEPDQPSQPRTRERKKRSKKSLKIAVFCWESLYSERVGGLAPVATHLAEMAAREHEVHFFTRGEGGEEEIAGVHYHYYAPRGANIVEYCHDMSMGLLERCMEQDRPPFDILHFHDWHFVDALQRVKERKTILSFHSTEYGRNGGKFGDWWEFKEISGKEWFGANIAKTLTTVSETTRNEIIWLYHVPAEKIHAIPNGINPDEYRVNVDPGAVRQKYGMHPVTPLVFFVGRLVYQKGPDMLLDAVPLIHKKRPDVQFLIAGEGYMRQYLEEKAGSLPVRFLGFVSNHDHLELLNSADIVVIPSRNEPFGLVLTEAWSAERCVVASDVGGLAENIDNFVNGIKVPVRPESFAWGVNYLFEDPGCIRDFGLAGRRKVEDCFTWDTVGGRMLEIYADAVKR